MSKAPKAPIHQARSPFQTNTSGAGNAATRWSFNNRPRDGVLAVAFVEARFWLLLGQGVPRQTHGANRDGCSGQARHGMY